MEVRLARVKVYKEAGILALDKLMPMYETAVLRVAFGEESVEVLDRDSGIRADVEAPEDEFKRLGNLYGSDKERNAKRVELIYGFYETGQFEKAFDDCLVSDDELEVPLPIEVSAFTKSDGTPYKRKADLMRELKSKGVSDNYEVMAVEDGFIGSPT